MPRHPRIHYPGAVYHVMARGVDGREVFTDDLDRRFFLETMIRLKSETPFAVLAYCLMPNHFHLAIKVESIPLSRIMHRLLTTYVLAFNSRRAREGHLFQARYKSILCLNDRYLMALIRYIHMNPVRAGMVSRANDWPWSSHRNYSGKAATTLADTRLFFEAAGASVPSARDYERWSAESDADFQPWPEAKESPPLLRKEPIGAESIEAVALNLFPADLAELKSGSRRHELAMKKSQVARRAIQNGHSLVSIAAWMSCTPQGVHRLLNRNSEKSESLTPTV
jgi:REP element-mobilizing transposase RayT